MEQRSELNTILNFIAHRRSQYETGVQTTVYGKAGLTRQHLLTKVELVGKGETQPDAVTHEYPEIVISRRSLSSVELTNLVTRLVIENELEIAGDTTTLTLQWRLSGAGRTRRNHSEWSRWPAEVFEFEPVNAQNFPGNTPLIALEAPYYPSLDQVLADFFHIRSQGWTNYLRGQVAVVIPDFRARIAKFTIAPTCLRADLECRFCEVTDLVAKVYAGNYGGRLLQETVPLTKPHLELELQHLATFACLALMCRTTKDVLDERVFKDGVSWREPGVIIEMPEQEIEQLLLSGESETVEFREKLDKSRPERLARTVVAFANTKGGTIVFGIDDDHHAVGCTLKGMEDTITNIIRSYCEPVPEFSIGAVDHENTRLLLVRIGESSNQVHTVRDLGPFIRANATNRSPTSYELTALFLRRGLRSPWP